MLTVGETMALLDPVDDGVPSLGSELRLRVAGAESNFAIALSRLGVVTTWASSLGSDFLGDLVVAALQQEGVDLRYVTRRDDAPTALFLKWRAGGRSHVVYYRSGSAASLLGPHDLPEEALEGIDHVHLTGITMAIGPGPRDLVSSLARRSHERGIPVTFDPNYRPALWSSPGDAQRAHAEVYSSIDWYLCGLEEGEALFDVSGLDALIERLDEVGLTHAAVRVGADGAVVKDGSRIERVEPDVLETVLDEIGAGDGFAAGFVSGLLQGWPAARCAHSGNVIAGRALRGTGDWETFPRLEEVQDRLRPGERSRK